ncbi:MAG TPA: hypothetical protein VIK33_04535 [Anaerolineae bacterium]
MNRVAVQRIVYGVVITAPTWLGLISGVSLDNVIPLQSVAVLLVAAGYLVESGNRVVEEVPVTTHEGFVRKKTSRRDD